MYLLLTPRGGKYWRFDYRFEGKRKTAALGTYPQTSLQEARVIRTQYRESLKNGIDPCEALKREREQEARDAASSFKAVAEEWHAKQAAKWTPRYAAQVMSVLQRDFFPVLGDRPLKSITAQELLKELRKIESRGALDALADARAFAGRIFRYGIAIGHAERDVAADLCDAFEKNIKQNHNALSEAQLPKFLKALDKHTGGWRGRLGIKMILLTMVRTTELRAAKWSEISEEKAQWIIPANRMKMRRAHVVPLSRQALEVLKEIKKQSADSGKPSDYLFPNQRGKGKPFMSENTMLNLLDDMPFDKRTKYGDHTTVHGLRSTASTILYESGKFGSLEIERQLAHVDKNTVRGTYNKAEYLDKRAVMMQWWADYLDEQAAKED